MNTFYIISTHTFIYFFIFFKSTLAKKYRLMTNTGIHNSMSCLSMVPPNPPRNQKINLNHCNKTELNFPESLATSDYKQCSLINSKIYPVTVGNAKKLTPNFSVKRRPQRKCWKVTSHCLVVAFQRRFDLPNYCLSHSSQTI